MVFPDESYDGEDWMIIWKAPNLTIGPWPDYTGWSPREGDSTGYCYAGLHRKSDREVAERLVGQALYLISDGVPVETVLREFAKIRVWREMKIKLLTPGEFFAFLPSLGYGVINPYQDPYREDPYEDEYEEDDDC